MTTKLKLLPSDIHAKIEQCRHELLTFEMREAIKRQSSSCHYLFYKPMTALTAFVINLRGNEFSIEVTYGYASTAFTRMAGDEKALVEWGVSDEDITIREKATFFDEADEIAAKWKIAKMYITYLHTQKDELLFLLRKRERHLSNRFMQN